MKSREIIVEYKREETKQRLGDKLWSNATQRRDDRQVKNVDDLLAAFENSDPTNNKQYVVWIANRYNKQEFRYEDLSRVAAALTKFQTYQRNLSERDINKYTLLQLENAIEKIESGKSQETSKFTDELPEQTKTVKYDVLYQGPLGWLVRPETQEASQILGRQTKWCTAYTTAQCAFDDYNQEGNLYIWRGSDGKKYQFFFPTKWGYDTDGYEEPELGWQFMDASDRPIDTDTLTQFRTQHPVLKRLFAKQEQNIAKYANLAYTYARDIIGGRWPPAESAILKAKSFEIAIYYAKEVIGGRWPEAENFIMTSRVGLLTYLKEIIKGDRWPEAESRFASESSRLAVLYARNNVKKRWPEGEDSIIKDPMSAAEYAVSVLKKPWPEAEKTIISSLSAMEQYLEKFGKLETGDQWKTLSPQHALLYAEYVKKGKCPDLEPIIKQDRHSLKVYKHLFK